jgi:lysophospholipase L1-like esterase
MSERRAWGTRIVRSSYSRLIGFSAALLLLSATALAISASAASATTPPPTTTYLALGDSISFGYTEEKFNVNYPNEAPAFFEEGFTNFFQKDLAKTTEVGKGITLVNDSCPGESSNTLIGENEAIGGKTSTEAPGTNGPGDYHPCPYHQDEGFPLHNSLGDLSQLEEALSLLKEGSPAHPVKAITLGIGSNDELAAVAQCEKEVTEEYETTGKSKYGGENPEQAVSICVANAAEERVFPQIIRNIDDVIGTIDSSEPGGGHYTGPIVLLGFYNPDAFVLPGSNSLQRALNKAIEEDVLPYFPNVTFANPFPVFNPVEKSEKKQKETICKYTEMCNPNVQKPGGKPAGEDGDIHPTVAGYKAIAKLVNEAYLANPAS